MGKFQSIGNKIGLNTPLILILFKNSGFAPYYMIRKIQTRPVYVKGRIGWQGLRADEFVEEGPYLVTGTDLQNGKVNWNTCYHITNEPN